MRKRIRAKIVVAFLWPISIGIPIAEADYYDGLRAYDSGDLRGAASEWQSEANQGDAQSQYHLGRLYEAGEGVVQNYVEAHKWYNLAASQGVEASRQARDNLASQMSAEALSQAQSLAAEWEPMMEPDATQQEEVRTTAVDPATRLLLAADGGDLESVTSLLESGVDPNVVDEDGWTALLFATVQRHGDVISALLDAGADAAIPTRDGVTPVQVAVQIGNLDALRRLLEAGAYIEQEVSSAVLLLAIANEERETVDLLLEAGASADAQDPESGETALTMALQLSAEAATKLIHSGADVNQQTGNGVAPIHVTTASGDLETSRLLLDSGANPNAQTKDGSTPLMIAALSGNIELVKLLVQFHAEVGIVRPDGVTAIAIAESKDQREIVELLRQQDLSEESLWRAAEAGDVDWVKQHVDSGIDVNAADKDGWTALMFAIAGNMRSTISLLMERGADINVKDVDGSTPLMVAIIAKSEETAIALIEAGADVTAARDDGVTARSLAEANGLTGVRDRLAQGDKKMVAEIQQMLNALGYEAGPVDGVMGGKTRSAIRKYVEVVKAAKKFPANSRAGIDGEPSKELVALIRTVKINQSKPQVSAGKVVSATVIQSPSAPARQSYEPEMVKVQGSCFEMGSPPSESGRSNDERRHQVCVEDFHIGKYEVTQAEWESVMGGNPSPSKGSRHPVERVSWNDVQEYIGKLNARTGKRYRLPTEAEWEYACRSGGKPEQYCGGNDVDRVAWHNGNSGRKIHPVGGKQPNGLGLFDMSGNVWEWTCSIYDSNFGGRETHCATQHDVGSRVNRGGSFTNALANVRAASRTGSDPAYRGGDVGFRLAQDN